MSNQKHAVVESIMRGSLLATLATTTAMFAGASALAADDFIQDTTTIGHTNNGVVTSDQFLELGVPTSNALRIEGEQSMRLGSLDKAIQVLQRSVEMSPSDMDSRTLYAEALEKKLMKQKDRDPVLYNFLIKQWLYVNKHADFGDQSGQAATKLKNLTGVKPSKMETGAHYLHRVLIPEDGSVKVALGKKKSGESGVK